MRMGDHLFRPVLLVRNAVANISPKFQAIGRIPVRMASPPGLETVPEAVRRPGSKLQKEHVFRKIKTEAPKERPPWRSS